METLRIDQPTRPEPQHRVAPWWMGWVFLLPLRRLWENPRRLLGELVRPGDRVLELGCGMGYFTLPLADLAGPGGRVVAVDVEPRVLAVLRRRIRGGDRSAPVELRLASGDDPRVDDLAGTMDLVVAHHVIHETTDAARVLGRLAAALRPGGRLWLAEPTGHVSGELFAREAESARQAGLREVAAPRGARQMIIVLEKPET